MVSLPVIWKDFLAALPGLPLTLIMVIVPLAVALPIGFLMAIVNVRRVPVVSQLFRVYISFMRGTPIIVQILLLYNFLPLALANLFAALNIPFDIYSVDNILYACVIFSLSEIAILAEVFRAAINGIDEGQLEAAECSGLTLFQSYVRIIIPQAVGDSIPVLGNAVSDLIKTTSLAFSMAIADVMGLAKVAASASMRYIDAYIAVFLIYLVLVFACERLFALLDRKLNRRRRGVASTGDAEAREEAGALAIEGGGLLTPRPQGAAALANAVGLAPVPSARAATKPARAGWRKRVGEQLTRRRAHFGGDADGWASPAAASADPGMAAAASEEAGAAAGADLGSAAAPGAGAASAGAAASRISASAGTAEPVRSHAPSSAHPEIKADPDSTVGQTIPARAAAQQQGAAHA